MVFYLKSFSNLMILLGDVFYKVITMICWRIHKECGILQTIYEDGKFYNETTLTIIRGKLEDLVSKDHVELV